MRKLTAVALVFATSFAMANNGQEENVNPTTTQQTEQTQQVYYEEIFKIAEEEAIYCEVTRSNGDVVRCVLCNCKKLADEAQEK